MIVEYLSAIATLDVLFLHYIEANWTQEWVDKFLISLRCVFLSQLIVSSEFKDISLCRLLYPQNELPGFSFLVLLQPGVCLERALIVRDGRVDNITHGGSVLRLHHDS